MVGKILIPEIKSLIDARNFAALRELFAEWPPADVAEVILDMPGDEQVIIFRVLPHALAADVFEYLDLDAQQKLLRAMAHEQVVGILNEMSPDDRTALPVVDSADVLVGIVTIDDMLDVAEEEATEDIQKFGGLEALDEPYMRISLWRMVRKRAGWLVILFLGEMLTATAMANYQDEIAKAVVLALFLPLIISSGGNSGSQASTLIIRAMALGEVTLRDWWRVASREIRAGLSLGVILGVIGAGRVALWSIVGDRYMHRQLYGPHWPLVALTVGAALVGVVLWGSLSGSMLPFILRRVGADPATSSAPFVATLVDVTGLIIYFSIALLIMRGAML